MSELLKLKFEPYWIEKENEKGWKVVVEYADKNIIGCSFEVFNPENEYEVCWMTVENSFVTLSIVNMQGCEKLINVDSKFSYTKDKAKSYTVNIGKNYIELKSFYNYPCDADIDGETILINVMDGWFSYLNADDLEEVMNALEMLKPEMEKYRNTMRDKELAKEKRKKLWLEKEPFEFAL